MNVHERELKISTAIHAAWKYVENDGSAQNMIYITGLKNIYSKQLPNMPREYVARLVYDRRHKSTALVKKNGAVIGGITYRAFPEQRMGEICFCAVTASEQVKGYGTRLMNTTKEHARTRDNITHFLTFADNNAVGYFTKQGFTREITMSRDQWFGFIKDYDGGTLMECVIHPSISYTQFPQMLSTQRQLIDAQVRQVSRCYRVHKGLSYFKEGSEGEIRPPLDIGSIRGVREAGWSPEQAKPSPYLIVFKEGIASASNPESLFRFMSETIKELAANPDAWPFLKPVPLDQVPDYLNIIKDPIDISLVEGRINSRNYYLTLDIWLADARRIFANCRRYNAADTIYVKLANKLEIWLNVHLTSHVVSANMEPLNWQ